MYRVTIENNNIETIINEVSTDNYAQRISGTVKQGINSIDSFSFTILPNNIGYNLIFPMKCSSDDIDYESHNLWLIDERLAYSSYVASDVSLNTKKMMIDLIYCYWIIRLLFLTSRMMEQNLIL